MSTLSFTARSLGVLRVLISALVILVLVVGTARRAAADSERLSPGSIHGYSDSIVMSVGRYWDTLFTAAGHPQWNFEYWTSGGPHGQRFATPCGPAGDPDVFQGASPASYCMRDDSVYLSTSWLFNHASNNGTTPYGVANVIAHEVGHAAQAELGLLRPGARVKPQELQADCFAGAWVRNEVLNRRAGGKEIQDAQIQVQSVGDYEFDNPDHHGTADERVKAWRRGLEKGVGKCLR